MELVAVCDTNFVRASEIAAKFGSTPFNDYRSLPVIDGVVVAAPTTHHAEICSKFLNDGVGVLCEKPMASTVDGCESILAARDRRGAPLLIGHTEHFNPAVQAIRGQISFPGFLEVHRLGVFVPRSLDVDVVLDLMIHDIEMAQSLTGMTVKKVEAVGVSVLTTHIDICNARLLFDGGCVANLTASRISKDKVRKLRIFQPSAYISVDYAEQTAECYRVEAAGDGKSIVKLPVEVKKEEPLARELSHFAAVLRGEMSPEVGGEDALQAVATAQMILDSAREASIRP